MVEAGATGVTEQEILDALDIAHGEIKKLTAAIEELPDKVGKEKIEIEEPKVDEELLESIKGSHGAKLDEATQVEAKLERQDAIDAVEDEVIEQYAPTPATTRRPTASAHRGQGRLREAREGHDPQAHRRRQEAPRRPRARTRSARSRPRSTSRRGPTARRCSPAERRRSSPSSRSAPPGWT